MKQCDMQGFCEYLTTQCKYSERTSIYSSRSIKKLREFYGDKDIINRDVEEMVVCMLGYRPETRTIRSWRYAVNKYKDYLLYLSNAICSENECKTCNECNEPHHSCHQFCNLNGNRKI